MILKQIPVAGDRNFGYLLLSGGEAAIVDPGEDPSGLLRALDASAARLRWVIGTHGHADHLCGLPLIPKGDWRLVLSRNAGQPADLCPEDQERLALGGEEIQLLPTPGHTPCSHCLLVPGETGEPGHVLTGDTLFVGKIGGTATEEQARTQYDSLHKVLLALPAETRVWPGHDVGVRPFSSIGQEARENPFLLQADFAAFLHLKQNWAAYKKEHGIA